MEPVEASTSPQIEDSCCETRLLERISASPPSNPDHYCLRLVLSKTMPTAIFSMIRLVRDAIKSVGISLI